MAAGKMWPGIAYTVARAKSINLLITWSLSNDRTGTDNRNRRVSSAFSNSLINNHGLPIY